MGIAYGSRTLDEIGGEAQNNLDVALVRGGDQVVVKEVKEGAKPVYYGGNLLRMSNARVFVLER